MARTLILRPSAKINLTLHVGPLRANGFHDVRTLLQSIAISDTLTLTARRGPFAVTTNAPGVPLDRTNLVWRAAEILWRAFGRPGEPAGVQVKIQKQIPVAAGLGGGSADAAAALLGLNAMWNGRLPRRELVRLGAGIGSDVPFFFQGGAALGVGRGEELYPVDDVPRLGVVIIKPSFGVPTADAYRWLDEDRRGGQSASVSAAGEIDLGWATGPVALVNDLQAAVARRHPAIEEMVAACLSAGALAAAMTGSGSAVFGLFPEPLARKALRRLERPDWQVLPTRTLTRREASRRVRL